MPRIRPCLRRWPWALALVLQLGWAREESALPNTKVFTLQELRMYNGSNAAWPILIAINGSVFDVSNGTKFYYPGKAYAKFAGRDVTRNTALFSTEDRDLDRTDYPPDREAYLRKIYYKTYVRKYPLVGTIDNRNSAPMPEELEARAAVAAAAPAEAAAAAARVAAVTAAGHGARPHVGGADWSVAALWNWIWNMPCPALPPENDREKASWAASEDGAGLWVWLSSMIFGGGQDELRRRRR